MSTTLWAVVVGGVLTGAFLIVGQVVAALFQAKAATDDWNRKQKAQHHAELESMFVDILRYVHQIENTVDNVVAGGTNLTGDEVIDTINSAARAVMVSGYSLIVRNGPDDPTPRLVGRVIDEARTFSALYLVGRNPPATAAEKRDQSAVVSAAARALRTHVHATVQADAEAQAIT